jgi:hypothetical protein
LTRLTYPARETVEDLSVEERTGEDNDGNERERENERKREREKERTRERERERGREGQRVGGIREKQLVAAF